MKTSRKDRGRQHRAAWTGLVEHQLVRGLLLLSMCICHNQVVCSDAAAHPCHTSIAEVELNTRRNTLEIALRVHPGDLHKAVQRLTNDPIDLEPDFQTPGVDRLVLDYLQRSFFVHRPNEQPLKLKWVGKETSLKFTWIYFEIPLSQRDGRLLFHNSVFFELLDDQRNTVNLKQGDRTTSLVFCHKQAEQSIQLPIQARNRNRISNDRDGPK